MNHSKYNQYYQIKKTQNLKEREREFYEILNQISQKLTEENLTELHHFLKRYIKAISSILLESFCIDFIASLLSSSLRCSKKVNSVLPTI